MGQWYRPRRRRRVVREAARWMLCFGAAGLIQGYAYLHELGRSLGFGGERAGAVKVRLVSQDRVPPALRHPVEEPGQIADATSQRPAVVAMNTMLDLAYAFVRTPGLLWRESHAGSRLDEGGIPGLFPDVGAVEDGQDFVTVEVRPQKYVEVVGVFRKVGVQQEVQNTGILEHSPNLLCWSCWPACMACRSLDCSCCSRCISR
ncbi:MAG: hypothetical protein ACODAJ_17135, partial [Planctomycetota bacterium]